MKTFLKLTNVLPRMYNSPFTQPMNWQMNKGETWSVIGNNGSGKTLFSEVICGQYNLIEGEIYYPFFEAEKKKKPDEYIRLRDYVKTVSFNSVYSISDFREMYYQQRFNSMETDCSPQVADFFNVSDLNAIGFVSDALNIKKLLTRRLVQLSSGELRKLLIAKILLEKPRMIIFDNPFIGLDVDSRKQLDETFHHLSKSTVQLLFLVPSVNDLPSVTTNVLKIDKGSIVSSETIQSFTQKPKYSIVKEKPVVDWSLFTKTETDYDSVVKMEDVEISYGTQIINKGINWEIKKGEKWALLGPNGSGKSTLLSYIFADNPQAYSKKLSLFGRKRGTGESIWDIKKHIGFTSSEMHLYYRENVSCLKVVESGFFDSIGLYRQCTDGQTRIARYFLELLNIQQLEDKLFLKISSGEQRLILFARALVKNPELLILDEPFHGLDDDNKNRCLQIVCSYCNQPNKSLIFVTHHQEEIPESVTCFLKL